jgi:carbonic anhydrase
VKPRWGYGAEDGPSRWASLDPSFKVCDEGDWQSPIDLAEATVTELPAIEFSYTPGTVELENNGHTVIASYPPGTTEIEIDGRRSELLQFHFHAHSEHTVEGNTFPLELHFVCEDAVGALTVVGVFGDEGEDNPACAPLVAELGKLTEEGAKASLPDGIDPTALMPADPGMTSRWSYSGSLTTPPCTEGVNWNVLVKPVELSAAQIKAFTDVFEDNFRPPQPRNGRELLINQSA